MKYDSIIEFVDKFERGVTDTPQDMLRKGHILDGIRSIKGKLKSCERIDSPTNLSKIERGDVFFAHVFGGTKKMRPWVVLHVKEDNSILAVCMTSSEFQPDVEKSECKYWDGYIGTSMNTFDINSVQGHFVKPFTAHKQLNRIERRAIKNLRQGTSIFGRIVKGFNDFIVKFEAAQLRNQHK